MKSILALLLVVAMCLTLLAACASAPAADNGNQDTTNNTAENNNAADTPDNQEEPADNEDEGEEDEALDFEGAVVNLYMLNESGTGNLEAQQAALNELLMEKIGVQVNITFLDMGNYPTQLSLAISGGEQVDLAEITPIPGSTFASITSNGQAMPLNDLLDEYGQGILAECGDYLNANTINGDILSIPVWRQKAGTLYVGWPTEIAEELGLADQANSMTSLKDVTELAKTIRANTDMYGFGGQRYLNGYANFIWGNDSFDAFKAYDTLGDTQQLVYLAEDGTAKLLLDNEDYMNEVKLFADWYANDLVWPDTITNSDTPDSTLLGSGVFFFNFFGTELGGENTKAAQAGIPISMLPIQTGMLYTSSFTMFSTFIPTTAKEPEAAMALLNLIFTDPEVETMLVFGVEGVNYEMKETGEAGYIGDANAMDCGWHMGDFWIGNSFLLPAWEGDGADFRERARQNLADSATSDALGFALDTSVLTDYIGALTGVTEQYWYAMMSGLWTEQLDQDFRSALNAAGLDDYVAEINNQLSNWKNG